MHEGAPRREREEQDYKGKRKPNTNVETKEKYQLLFLKPWKNANLIFFLVDP